MNIKGIAGIGYEQLQYLLLIGIAISLPFFTNFTSYLVLGLFVVWAIEGGFREKWTLLSGNYMALFLMALFLLYGISLFYSEFDHKLLERKMALLAFPLIIGSKPLTAEKIRKICILFAVAVGFASIYTFSISLYQAIVLHSSQPMFYQELTNPLGMNAIYFAAYVTFSLLVSFHLGLRKWQELRKPIRWLVIFYILWSLLFLILLSSKAFLMIVFILCNLYGFYLFRRLKKTKWVYLQVFSGLLFVALILLLPTTKERVKDVIETDLSVLKLDSFSYDTEFSGLSIRLVLWGAAWDVIGDETAWLLGVGAGDAQQKLNEKYRDYNLYTGNIHLGDTGYLGYNAHNQYVQIFLELGFIGLSLWLLILVFPLFQLSGRDPILLAFFIFLVAAFGITECYLDRHHGIIFFSFFYSLFSLRTLN